MFCIPSASQACKNGGFVSPLLYPFNEALLHAGLADDQADCCLRVGARNRRSKPSLCLSCLSFAVSSAPRPVHELTSPPRPLLPCTFALLFCCLPASLKCYNCGVRVIQPVLEGARAGAPGAAVDARPLAGPQRRPVLPSHEGDPDGDRHVRRNRGEVLTGSRLLRRCCCW